ncbi:pyridine nucleotide-disulfide oxidoreductase domain-containing protein 1-like [Tigriopus californicus]|uniref:pyridine nucleotide-disulfide oxidoreductase domain-containing protein 1-like n=1 Tax=Tigriopus californicus TaxID=6832 RepID=UPI0027DA3785|nr:pyridine nucleotide-disulfide oxidoreductase domain-containing protein 1-like [Tigriopus californicus]
MESYTFVVVGGGIAGVSCVEMLCHLRPDNRVLLITASQLVKAVANVSQLTQILCSFDVEEQNYGEFSGKFPNLTVVQDTVLDILPESHQIRTDKGLTFHYEKLCLCHGARPRLLSDNEFVLGIRDTESVQVFQNKLKEASRVVIVGNGGIATELVHELKGVDVIWVIKDETISATFVDPGAGQFFLDSLQEGQTGGAPEVCKRMKYSSRDLAPNSSTCKGSALGPDWHRNIQTLGAKVESTARNVMVEFKSEVKRVLTRTEFQGCGLKESDKWQSARDWSVYIELDNGTVLGSDFVVSATGVTPNGDLISGHLFEQTPDLGIKVDDNFRTNVLDVFAAGDVCTTTWTNAPHWFQMRLWTQARQMGLHVGQCMNASLENRLQTLDFSFEMFTHVTKFFGYKVVLLGLFNGQTLNNEYEILLRITKGQEYVKTILKDGRMHGAILIGETDLEETFENLILNQMDLSSYGEDLLDPSVDIEDYFD